MDIRFDHLQFLHLLWMIPLLAMIWAWGSYRARQVLNRFASPELLAFLMPQGGRWRPMVRAGLVLAGVVALIVALTGPRWGMYWDEVPPKGIDLMIVLDVSRSMLAQDVTPNRLERAKLFIEDLVRCLPGDRVGLITFAGKPSVACPLTTNYGWLLTVLDQADTYSTSLGGSALGDAIRLAADSFLDRVQDHKCILIFSDGEDQESFPVDAARSVYQEGGIRVVTVGLGDGQQGARIPVDRGGQQLYLTYDGQEVWSKMNAALLQETALAGGGAFVPAGTQTVDMADVYQTRLATMAQREFEQTGKIQKFMPRFQWLASLGMALLIVESLVSETGRIEGPTGADHGLPK